MCGRFSQTQSAAVIADQFQLSQVPPLSPRYNIAPTQPVPVVLLKPQQGRQFELLRWGLIPAWAKDPSIGSRMINARSETVAEKPAFRTAFRRRRCLVLADGFYEWQQVGRKKQPFYFHLQDRKPFAFAGLWEQWEDKSTGEAIASCTLLTTEPNALLETVHNRMPVILAPQDYDLWLDPTVQNLETLQPLLHPYAADAMVGYAVSLEVNRTTNDSPACIQRSQPEDLPL